MSAAGLDPDTEHNVVRTQISLSGRKQIVFKRITNLPSITSPPPNTTIMYYLDIDYIVITTAVYVFPWIHGERNNQE